MTSPTSPTGPVIGDDEMRLEREALAWAALEQRAKKEKDTRRALLNQQYREGRTEHVRTPTGDRLGNVQKTNPDPVWQVVDPDAVEAHIRATYPGALRRRYWVYAPSGSLELSAEDELAVVLREYAPHLLVEEDSVDPAAVEALLAESKELGRPVAPGIALVQPAGTVRVVPDRNAFAAVMRMHRAGLLDLESMALALPRAEHQEVA